MNWPPGAGTYPRPGPMRAPGAGKNRSKSRRCQKKNFPPKLTLCNSRRLQTNTYPFLHLHPRVPSRPLPSVLFFFFVRFAIVFKAVTMSPPTDNKVLGMPVRGLSQKLPFPRALQNPSRGRNPPSIATPLSINVQWFSSWGRAQLASWIAGQWKERKFSFECDSFAMPGHRIFGRSKGRLRSPINHCG